MCLCVNLSSCECAHVCKSVCDSEYAHVHETECVHVFLESVRACA